MGIRNSASGGVPTTKTRSTWLMFSAFTTRRPLPPVDSFRLRAPYVIGLLFLIVSSLGLSEAESVFGPFGDLKFSHGRGKGLELDSQRAGEVTNSSEFQRFFEVSKPVTTSCQRPVEIIHLLSHDFADTYGVPPPAAKYTPSKRVRREKWDKIVLKWSAVCRGRQFDRIAGVWLGGVEILRTCTAEPTTDGIIWEVEKDVTRFTSLWKEPQEVVVAIGNVVDSTYTGIINVTISVEFYRGEHERHLQRFEGVGQLSESKNFEEYSGKPADLIIPISEPTYINGGYWFQLSSDAEVKNSSLSIPRNTYRAVLEVCLSQHGNDEFWYTNPPNEYLKANNITSMPGNGSFREVVASIDDQVVAAVWPFAVVYTGGVNPLFWRPASAIGAFNLPSYDFDITPFVGSLVDGKKHTFSLTVTDALYLWLLQANLHIWVDPKQRQTTGSLVEHSVPSFTPTLESNFRGLDGVFKSKASRSISYAGHVASSFGNLTTSSSYTSKFFNSLSFAKNASLSIVDELTETEGVVVVKGAEKEIALERKASSYPLYLYYVEVVNPDTSTNITATLIHSLNEDMQLMKKKTSSFSSLRNSQKSTGELFISVNNTLSGIGATEQTLSYESSEGCYERSISTKNYTILSDTTSTRCFQTS